MSAAQQHIPINEQQQEEADLFLDSLNLIGDDEEEVERYLTFQVQVRLPIPNAGA